MNMVTTGFSKPYVAKYANSGTSVTYTDGMVLARGVDFDLEIETADDNNFHADNVIAETEPAEFVSGTATITVDGLANAAEKLIMGLPEPTELTVDESPIQMQGYGAAMNPPFVGFACVRRTQMNSVVSYFPVILPKVKFQIPPESAATQEEQIEWQTQELTASVFRDDTTAQNWKNVPIEGLATEAEAEAVIKTFFSINDQG